MQATPIFRSLGPKSRSKSHSSKVCKAPGNIQKKSLSNQRCQISSNIGKENQPISNYLCREDSQVTASFQGNRQILIQGELKPQHQLHQKLSPTRGPQSPVERIIIRNHSPIALAKMSAEKEAGYLRKIKLLEQRIIQVHQEKQAIFIQLNESNRKLFHQNSILKEQLQKNNKNLEFNGEASMETTKSMELQNKIEDLGHFIQSEGFQSFQEENQQLKAALEEAKSETARLKCQTETAEKELSELKNTIVKNSQEIKQNNQQIILEFQKKLQLADEKYSQLQELMKSKEHNDRQKMQSLKAEIIMRESKIQDLEIKCQQLQSEETEKRCKKCQDLLRTVFKLSGRGISPND